MPLAVVLAAVKDALTEEETSEQILSKKVHL